MLEVSPWVVWLCTNDHRMKAQPPGLAGFRKSAIAILAISDTAVVLDHGTVVHSGTALGLQEQPELLERLLGDAR